MDKKLSEWRKQNLYAAGYAHFDEKVGLNSNSVWEYIRDPIKISKHGFYPFITYNKMFYKIKKTDKGICVNHKIRPICYSAHIDRCIYKYYGYLLNEEYNEYAEEEGISKCVVAYRTNLHKNNIHLAKEAFDFIKKEDSSVIVGDFKSFFDNLDHSYLKDMLCKVLDEDRLPNDWYAIYKNITKYSTWDLLDILKINNLITDEDILEREVADEEALKGKTGKARSLIKYFNNKIKELNGFGIEDFKVYSKKLALNKEQFKKYKKDYLEPNKKSFGIPQGSAISAVLSNVYMIDFDKKINKFIKEYGGQYLRYSDDFIIILPKKSMITFEELKIYLNEVIDKTNGLVLECEKTQKYLYTQNKIMNITNPEVIKESSIDYLGFVFDGENITIRPKTISKYYYKMYRKLNNIVKSKGITKKGNKISYTQLYKNYTQKGRNGEYDKSQLPDKVFITNECNPYKNGNFFSYVYKANKIFNNVFIEENKSENTRITEKSISKVTQRHMLKIRRIRDKI